ncbi:MAG: MBL fold metallo-hydrolase [Christensenellaceae bacterium]|jgi:glyoxylase-like metal-dependent hydrolase (beta-lactamase superfamily II)
MENIRFRILYLGTCEHEKYKLVRTDDMQEMIKSPTYAVLVDHPSFGMVLFDTGDSDDWQTINDKVINELYPTTEHYPLKPLLQSFGVGLDDISQVVLSHLHHDHVGGLRNFENKPAGSGVIVAEEEARDIFFKTIADKSLLGHAYTPASYEGLSGITYKTINGCVGLAEGLTLFVQRSHVSGLIGMILQLNDKDTVVFTSDSVYTQEAFDHSIPPGGALNVGDDDFLKNLTFLKALQKDLNATLFFGHDYDQARTWADKGWISALNQVV